LPESKVPNTGKTGFFGWNFPFSYEFIRAAFFLSQRMASNGHFTPCDQCPLRRRPSLREFSAEELAFVKSFKVDELRVETGASFLRQGTRSEYLYTVLNGWAFRYKMLDDGRRQILNYALPADMLGLQGALMNEMEHSVEALTPLVLCVFPRGKLWDLYRRLPSLAFDITWLAAREEQLIDEHLVSLGRRRSMSDYGACVFFYTQSMPCLIVLGGLQFVLDCLGQVAA
jgi:CRP-like cAMP-binding protein